MTINKRSERYTSDYLTKICFNEFRDENKVYSAISICMFFSLGERKNALPLYFVRPKFVTVITHHIRT